MRKAAVLLISVLMIFIFLAILLWVIWALWATRPKAVPDEASPAAA